MPIASAAQAAPDLQKQRKGEEKRPEDWMYHNNLSTGTGTLAIKSKKF
jgi:hypothetical protein